MRLDRNVCMCLSVLAALAACEAQPISSVDGLNGGSILSEVTVPKLTSNEVVADAVSAADVDVDNIAVGIRLGAKTVAADSLLVRGFPVFGLPVGVATLETSPGYAGADATCSAAYEGSHVCSVEEIAFSMRSGGFDDDFNGAAVNTHSFNVVAQDDEDNGFSNGRLFVVNDCDGWSSSRQAGETRVDDDNPANELRSNLGTSKVKNWADSYLSMFKGSSNSPNWRFRPNIDGCNNVRLACCG